MRPEVVASVPVAALLLASPATAWAYVGPGAGITVMGTVLALIGAIVFEAT